MKTLLFDRRLLAAACVALLTAGTVAADASPAAVPVITDVVALVQAQVPDHARAATAIGGRFNPQALQAGRISIPIGQDRRLEAKRLQEFRGGRGDLTWSGELAGAPGSMVIITSYRGEISGFLHHGAEIWEISSTPGGRTMVYQVDETLLPGDSEPLLPEFDAESWDEFDGTSEPPQTDVKADSPIVQDVLVVYTPKAEARAGSKDKMETRILNAVAAANAAYINSEIGIRLNLVGMALTDYAETGDFTTSLSRLRGTTDGYMDEVHALRDRLGADLVALISEDSTYCGVAYVMGKPSTSFASAAFSVTKQSCFSNQTFAHEIGHNQGNSHDRANGGGGSFPYSFGYRTCDNVAPTNGQSFRTVMAYSCSGTPRVNYFSNPHVHFNGAPMGVDHNHDAHNAADNARSMHETAPYVAAFRGATNGTPPKDPSDLRANAEAWDRVTLTWNDNAADENGYVIQRSVNGGSYADRASLPANTTQYTDAGLSGDTAYSYRVRAYNSAGSSGYSNAASVRTPSAPPPPSEPSPAEVAPGSPTQTRWAAVSNISSYDVVRETLNPRNGKWSATTLTVSANTTTLSESLASGTYRYRVRAVGPSGSSAYVIAHCDTCGSDGSFTLATASSTTTKTKGGGPKSSGDKDGGPGNSSRR